MEGGVSQSIVSLVSLLFQALTHEERKKGAITQIRGAGGPKDCECGKGAREAKCAVFIYRSYFQVFHVDYGLSPELEILRIRTGTFLGPYVPMPRIDCRRMPLAAIPTYYLICFNNNYWAARNNTSTFDVQMRICVARRRLVSSCAPSLAASHRSARGIKHSTGSSSPSPTLRQARPPTAGHDRAASNWGKRVAPGSLQTVLRA
eukprot:6172942-Pleurochrysis_carterae.AAC.2